MSLKALSDYTVYAKYAHYIPELDRRETWEESVKRVFDMHRRKYAVQIAAYPELQDNITFAEAHVIQKNVLGSQRALQFGGPWIEKHNAKMFNCQFLYVDKPIAFYRTLYLLLCGCGVGFSVQKHHIARLPYVAFPNKGTVVHTVEDSIEGWADALQHLLDSYFEGTSRAGFDVAFDFSLIRPEGSIIAGQFKAPGPEGLVKALEKIRKILDRVATPERMSKLRPIDAYDIMMHSSDCVLSGGIRRSATICLYSFGDEEMRNAKIGDWFIENPQRARSNNSEVLIRKIVTRQDFHEIIQSTKDFGDPGFFFCDSSEHGANPCVEIGLYPVTKEGVTGVQACNLTEINGRKCTTEALFLEACKAATIIGTLQAGYTDVEKFLGKETKEIYEREALLGVSITGIMDNPDILLNPEIQKRGALLCKQVNGRVADMLGINHAARITCIKPAGTTSCVLGTASGIHPHHAKRYIRRVQANRNEFAARHFESLNPAAVEKSVWSASGTDLSLSFMCEVPKGAKLKNDLSALDLLKTVRGTQINWVWNGKNEELCVDPSLSHNVSNTITVQPDEWEAVADFLYDNRQYFTGVSLLSASGDLDYPQAPFTTVLTPDEMVRKYGDGAVLGSGLVVDGLHAFDGNLWTACSTALGYGENLDENLEVPVEPIKPVRRQFKSEKAYNLALCTYAMDLNEFYRYQSTYNKIIDKLNWIRRAKQFAARYFNNDLKHTTHCLKHLAIWHRWLELKRTYIDIDWDKVVEDRQELIDTGSLGAAACSGGKCEII